MVKFEIVLFVKYWLYYFHFLTFILFCTLSQKVVLHFEVLSKDRYFLLHRHLIRTHYLAHNFQVLPFDILGQHFDWIIFFNLFFCFSRVLSYRSKRLLEVNLGEFVEFLVHFCLQKTDLPCLVVFVPRQLLRDLIVHVKVAVCVLSSHLFTHECLNLFGLFLRRARSLSNGEIAYGFRKEFHIGATARYMI